MTVQERILAHLKDYPRATQKELANVLPNISLGGVKYHLTRLKNEGRLIRSGGDRGGFWIVVEQK